MDQNKKILVGFFAAATLILIIFNIVKNKNTNNDGSVLKIGTTTQSTKITSDSNKTLGSGGGTNYTVEQVPIVVEKNNVPIPDLNRQVSFSSKLNFTDEYKKMISSKILDLQTELKKDPKKMGQWIDLGSYQKATGDYEGALASWSYVSEVAPTDYISLGNIGNLYAYYLKNNGMAEVYYNKAISRGPKQSYLYGQLAEVYRDVFGDLDRAREIIDQGLKNIPLDQYLLSFKSSLK